MEASLRQLLPVLKDLIRSDFERLAQAIRELAHGNLAGKLEVRAKALPALDAPGAGEMAGLYNELLKRLTQCAADFNTLTQMPCQRLCYVGTDSYLEGQTCGEALGGLVGRGRVAILTTFGPVSLELRSKGFQSLLAKHYPGVEVAAILNLGPVESLKNQASELLNAVPDLKGLYLTRGGMAAPLAHSLDSLGKASQVKVVCHDLLEETLSCLHRGLLSAALGQDPFAQGYNPVIYLYNHLVANWQPPSPRMLTQTTLVTAGNLGQFWSPAGGRVPLRVEEHHAKPVTRDSPRPLRIAFLGREDNALFDDVRAGVNAAADILGKHNITLEWMVPEANRSSGAFTAAAYEPLLSRCIENRVDGVVVGIFDAELIPAINRAAQSGIPVVTYNSEPGGLRSMVQMSRQQAERLTDMSRTMAGTLEQVSQATAQIDRAMAQVSEGTLTLNTQFVETRESLNSLMSHVDDLSRQSSQGMAVAQEVAAASQRGASAVARNISSLQEIAGAVGKIAATIEQLGENSDKINLIIKMISSIAYQIKLLGINAAIEAAQAGEFGAGFSIVAGEIRSLAERTAQASRDITDVILAIKGQIGAVQVFMHEGNEKMTAGTGVAEEARAVLEQIHLGVEGNTRRFQTVSAAIGELQAFSQQIGNVVNSIATVSERNAASSQQVTASTREMLAQLEDAGRIARTVEAMSQGEQQLLAKFNLSNGDGV